MSKNKNAIKIKALRRLMRAEFMSIREAVDKVEKTNTAKFEAQNEWRQQMKDQVDTFVTRRELWAAVIVVTTLVISLVALIFKIK